MKESNRTARPGRLVPVPAFRSRMVCTSCGIFGADVRDAGLVEVCRQAPRLLLTMKNKRRVGLGVYSFTHIKKRTARSAFGQSGRLMLTPSLSGSDPKRRSTLKICCDAQHAALHLTMWYADPMTDPRMEGCP